MNDARTGKPMKFTFIQTADAYRYAQMLSYSAQTVTEYARLKGYRYESFLGLKRGEYPWQATFNRVFMLTELIDREIGGWVCYMDADAWVHDLDYDLEVLFAGLGDAAAVFTPSGASDHWWDVNAGVFFVNLDHPDGVRLCQAWKKACLEKWGFIADKVDFPAGGPDDQSILHELLAAEVVPRSSIGLTTRAEVNSQHAAFIRQHLRGDQRSFEHRVAFIRETVHEVLTRTKPEAAARDETVWAVTQGLYRGLLGRDADPDGARAYYELIISRGVRDGVAAAADSISNSPEFRARRLAVEA
ncbi:hypothetical protein [Brevundimonas sp.]|uniref:hypothetical protein n=1 Tax=Brevundimonas sp. TaxID=1871086 RepID=UPI002ED9D2E4